MYYNKYITLLFASLFSFSKAYSQGTTTLTINSAVTPAVYTARDQVKAIPGSKITAGTTTSSQLIIDKNIIAPININGNPYSGYSVNSVYTIDKNLPVGVVEGEFSINNGQANYNIPISLAPGTANMTPNLNLSYNSSQSNGIAGSGWNISGMSSITRLPTNFFTNLVGKQHQFHLPVMTYFR